MKVDVSKLKAFVGEENVLTDAIDRYIYGTDASVHESMASAVVAPTSYEQVQQVVKYANAELIPIVPRGSGSGMSGQAVPVNGGIILDLKRLNHILEIKPEDMLCRVEAGVVDDDLNRAVKPHGLFYPPAPASSRVATIGGEIANNASGVRSVKYGATRDSVLGMKVVLANGDLVTLGSNTRVEASGYQVDRLMVGSEGTLGIIVEATMLLKPLPKFRCLGRVCFNQLSDAGECISDIIASGRQPSLLELMDNIAITAVNTTLDMGLPDVEAIIMFEADGMVKEAVDFEIGAMKKICEKHNGFDIQTSYDAKERTKLFAGRKKLFAALSRYKDGLSCTSLADDMAVPYSQMSVLAEKIHEVADRNNVVMTAYGHCGSGCMHTKILMDPTRKEQWNNARNAVKEIYEFVYSVGGTTSAEHGIGISKAPSWKQEKQDSLELLKMIKKALDPNNILNPGKLQDAADDWVTATPLRYRAS